MDIQSLVEQLRQEAGRIERAIAALAELDHRAVRRGRPPKARQSEQAIKPKRRTMSAAGRARVAAAQRERWAKQKAHIAPARGKKAGRKPMSPAMRKKMSAMMKARWAARKMG